MLIRQLRCQDKNLRYISEGGAVLGCLGLPVFAPEPVSCCPAQGKADDYEIAAAQIGVEVYSAMSAAIA